jgi:hypothetical protein
MNIEKFFRDPRFAFASFVFTHLNRSFKMKINALLMILSVCLITPAFAQEKKPDCIDSQLPSSPICVGDTVIYQPSKDRNLGGGPNITSYIYAAHILKMKAILPNFRVTVESENKTQEMDPDTLVKMTGECIGVVCPGQIVLSGFSPAGHPGAPMFKGWVTQIYGSTPDQRFVFTTEGYSGRTFVASPHHLDIKRTKWILNN